MKSPLSLYVGVCLLLHYLLQICSRGGGGGHVLRETSRGKYGRGAHHALGLETA
jgi:hypothetical protein